MTVGCPLPKAVIISRYEPVFSTGKTTSRAFLQSFEATISSSQAATVSNLFKELGRRISVDDYSDPTFTVDLLVKDVSLAVEMARKNGLPPILARCVELINEMAQAQGLGGSDTSIMWKSYGKIWGEPEKK